MGAATTLETRYAMLAHGSPEAARAALERAEEDVRRRWLVYAHLAAMPGRRGAVA
jgi:hypothetical protein